MAGLMSWFPVLLTFAGITAAFCAKSQPRTAAAKASALKKASK